MENGSVKLRLSRRVEGALRVTVAIVALALLVVWYYSDWTGTSWAGTARLSRAGEGFGGVPPSCVAAWDLRYTGPGSISNLRVYAKVPGAAWRDLTLGYQSAHESTPNAPSLEASARYRHLGGDTGNACPDWWRGVLALRGTEVRIEWLSDTGEARSELFVIDRIWPGSTRVHDGGPYRTVQWIFP
jgi:hypothetical protein